MSEQTENNISPEETELEYNSADSIDEAGAEHPGDETGKAGAMAFIFPLLVCVLMFVGFSQEPVNKKSVRQVHAEEELNSSDSKGPKINFSALLAAEEFSKNLRDTVYTNEDMWLELRIDQQVLYVHYRDGRTKTYNVSTGNRNLSKGIESRPGLFAVFLKEEVHLSSQFNNARMNYYMPYNMGIGFHGLPGSGYYGFLGKQPSSHGCIRMRNEDVKVLFKETKVGTIVLAHRGHTNRVVAFAPEGFKNDAEYTKDDYIGMLAYNLASIMEGKYFINPPKRFILDGTILPKSGVTVLSTDEVPEKQLLPFAIAKIEMKTDLLNDSHFGNSGAIKDPENLAEKFGVIISDSLGSGNIQLAVAPEVIKKYAYNPVGVLPYFAPNK
ncbi:MAG: L,D-transpeptidase [Ignavibacteria bacterium]